MQATKHGFVFVLDRETGAPLFPVEERPVPASDVPGERAWPTQPVPIAPPPLVPQRLDRGRSLRADARASRARAASGSRELRNDGLFTPPSLRGSVLYPFTGGGANWSGASFDPARQLLVVPVQNLVHIVRSRRSASARPAAAARVQPLQRHRACATSGGCSRAAAPAIATA